MVDFLVGAVHLLRKTLRGRGVCHFLIFSYMGEWGRERLGRPNPLYRFQATPRVDAKCVFFKK